MSKYISRRLLQGIPTFFGITLFAFLMMVFAPGDPVSMITFNPRSADTTSGERIRRQLGLDKPPFTQYIYWLIGNDWTLYDSDGDGVDDSPGTRRGLLRGDLGNSLSRSRRPVMDMIIERIPATLLLTFSALVVGYGVGILLGLLAAVYHRTWVDQIIRIISVIGNAVPQFWLGFILIIVFSIQLKALPMSGMRNISSRGFDLWDIISHMVLPVFVLSLNTIAFVSRFTRTELLEVLEQDFIRTARAKGLKDNIVWWKHALRNALLPVATFLGPGLGTLLAGAVVVESVFAWPGLGSLVVDGVFQRDYPLVMGSVVIAAIMFILGVLLSDILYAVLDPRIRLE
jgi:peptide/nickel transport system permease protein